MDIFGENKYKPMKIYHYTTLDALINMINGHTNICMWATRFDFLNDPTEKDLGKSLLLEGIDIFKKENKRDLFNGTISNLNDLIDVTCRPFIMSFSEVKDNVPMWNMYGNKGKGVILEFDTSYFKDLFFYSCYYGDKEATDTKNMIQEILKDREYHYGNQIVSGYNNLIKYICTLVKIKEYSYEKEWRICLFENTAIEEQNSKKRYPLYPTNEVINHIQFRIKDNNLIPYVKFDVSRKALTKVILGRYLDESLKKSLDLFFIHEKMKVEIESSNCPYKL